MKTAHDEFKNNIIRAKNLGSIFFSLSRKTTGILDVSDLLRAELVLGVSAFDHYIHEIVRIGMLESYSGKRPKTNQFLKFRCSMESVILSQNNFSSYTWFENEIRINHSYQSFLQPEKISDALKLVSEKSVWESISAIQNIPSKDLKKRLNIIVDRRNKIAHEADRDPSFPDKRWPINELIVNDAIDFLDLLGEKIYFVIK